ncbi:hypothetical protein CAEBREN_30795 [Caenorhabditis brenneri]|uniref:Reverse transcriptase domain-containing protein n=1 Tax=Caenorhabditis brenneri TaxID=135651 RepID=G0PJP0_CAEBE|nr:hypothetical protein CAEBREN_30795 [Caenorhabditis brenneri]
MHKLLSNNSHPVNSSTTRKTNDMRYHRSNNPVARTSDNQRSPIPKDIRRPDQSTIEEKNRFTRSINAPESLNNQNSVRSMSNPSPSGPQDVHLSNLPSLDDRRRLVDIETTLGSYREWTDKPMMGKVTYAAVTKRTPPRPQTGGARLSTNLLTDEMEIKYRDTNDIRLVIDLPNPHLIKCPLCKNCISARGRGAGALKYMKRHIADAHHLNADFVYKCSRCQEHEPESVCGAKWIVNHLKRVHGYTLEDAVSTAKPSTRQQIANAFNDSAPFIDARKTSDVPEMKSREAGLQKFLAPTKSEDTREKTPPSTRKSSECSEATNQSTLQETLSESSDTLTVQEVINISSEDEMGEEPPKRRVNVWALIHENGKDAWIDSDLMTIFLESRARGYDSCSIIDPLNFICTDRSYLTTIVRRRMEEGYKKIIFPLCANDHWTLVTITGSTATFYDPMGNEPTETVKKMIDELDLDMQLAPSNSPRQRDSWNCGVFVMKMAEAYIKDTQWDLTDVDTDVKTFRRSLLTELKAKFNIFAEDIQTYRPPSRKALTRKSQSPVVVCHKCSRPATPILDVSRMEVEEAPVPVPTPEEPPQEWTFVGKNRKRGVTSRTPNTSPEAKRPAFPPVPLKPPSNRWNFPEEETEKMEVSSADEAKNSTPPKPSQIPSLLQMRISSPVPLQRGNPSKKHGKGHKKNTARKGPTKKVMPKGEPANLIVKIRSWFDEQLKMYKDEGSNLQRLTWLSDSLTAAIGKAFNGNKYIVEQIIKRNPPPLVEKGAMSTQTSRKRDEFKPRDRMAQEPNEPLRIQYAKNRQKTFFKIIGKQSEQCTINIDTVEQHFRKTLKAPVVSENAIKTVCGSIKKVLMPKTIEDPISSVEVKSILTKVKDTSPGTDGVKYSNLRWFDPEGERLAKLFEECRKHREIPSHWKEAETILLPKDCSDEEKKKPENWRPIALMATIYKLYSAVWSRRISGVQGVISPCQRGFQSLDGCNESIGILRMCIDTASVLNRNLSCSWLDLTNAFGSVPHELIRRSLESFGYPQSVIQIVTDMYKGATMKVKTADQKTQSIKIEAGVKQGDPISPTLFNICLEGIIRMHQMREKGYDCVGHKVRCLAFADDLAILTNNKDDMQEVIDKLDADCRSVSLIFKPKKCASLTIVRGAVDKYAKIRINGDAIRTMADRDTYRYLGVKTGVGGRASETEALIQVVKELQKVHETDLAPHQKLDILKTFLLPRLQHLYRNATPKLSELREFENVVMKSVKRYHNIPIKGSPVEYVQIPVKKGGLGVLSPRLTCLITFLTSTLCKLWSDDPFISSIHKDALSRITVKAMGLTTQSATIKETCEYLNTRKAVTKGGYSLFCRMNESLRTLSVIQGAPLKSMEFIPVNNEIGIAVQATKDSEIKVFTKADSLKLMSKLKDLVRSAMLKRFLEEKNVKSRVTQVLQHHPQSNRFVRDGRNCSIAAQRFVHPARLNLLSCNANTYDVNHPKGCRRCQADFESQQHILQNCHYSLAGGITQRHDRVMNRILQEIGNGRKAHYKIMVDMETGASRERPDIIMEERDGPEVLLADVTVPYENGVQAVERAWDKKIEKYKHFVEHYRKLGKKATILPLVVGSLGSYWPDTSHSLKMLGLSDGQIRNVIPEICQIALESSKNIYWRHVLGDNYKTVESLYCQRNNKEVRFKGEGEKHHVSNRFQPLKSEKVRTMKSTKEEGRSRSNAKKGPNWRRSKSESDGRSVSKGRYWRDPSNKPPHSKMTQSALAKR